MESMGLNFIPGHIFLWIRQKCPDIFPPFVTTIFVQWPSNDGVGFSLSDSKIL
jgi:hypothetical protein